MHHGSYFPSHTNFLVCVINFRLTSLSYFGLIQPNFRLLGASTDYQKILFVYFDTIWLAVQLYLKHAWTLSVEFFHWSVKKN